MTNDQDGRGSIPESDGAASTLRRDEAGEEWRKVDLGVIEFHSERVNPGLMKRFYAVTDDLKAAGCVVDLWLMDIATVLSEFDYVMEIRTTKPKPRPSYE